MREFMNIFAQLCFLSLPSALQILHQVASEETPWAGQWHGRAESLVSHSPRGAPADPWRDCSEC